MGPPTRPRSWSQPQQPLPMYYTLPYANPRMFYHAASTANRQKWTRQMQRVKKQINRRKKRKRIRHNKRKNSKPRGCYKHSLLHSKRHFNSYMAGENVRDVFTSFRSFIISKQKHSKSGLETFIFLS